MNSALIETPWQISVSPIITPSEVHKFFSRHGGTNGFAAPLFAAALKLTALETQSLLNEYAEQGLMTAEMDDDGLEFWHVSREGAVVFNVDGLGARNARWNKRNISKFCTQLRVCADFPDVLEISVGGRPAFGHSNGSLLVGVKLDRVPYSLPDDTLILESILEFNVAQAPISVLLYQDKIPQRLQHRLIAQGSSLIDIVSPRHEIDLGENAHISALMRTLPNHLKFNRDSLREWASNRYDLMHVHFSKLDEYLDRELRLALLPIDCKGSGIALGKDIGPHLAPFMQNSNFIVELYKCRNAANYSWRKHTPAVEIEPLTSAEFALAMGQIEQHCASLSAYDESFLNLDNWRIREGDRVAAVVAAIMFRWETLEKNRTKARAGKEALKTNPRSPEVRYSAIFDTLNFDKPHLVGFVRQPLSQNSHEDGVEQLWGRALKSISGSIGEHLYSAGFHAGYLSISYRPATEDEIRAYDALSKAAGGTLAYIVNLNSPTWLGIRVRNRDSIIDVNPPSVITHAVCHEPLPPKLLVEHFPGHSGARLFDEIHKLPAQHMCRSNERLINANAIKMIDFVDSYIQNPASLLVQAAELEQWDFARLPAGWTGLLMGENWSISLIDTGTSLMIDINTEDEAHTQLLAPYDNNRFLDYRQYEGELAQVLWFMRRLQGISEKIIPNSEHPGMTPLELLVDDVNFVLHGSLTDFVCSDGTDWPTIQVGELM
jgi:hypothetical protein